MIEPINRTVLLLLYHLTIALGIILLPLAIIAKQGGFTLPIHRIITRLESAYQQS